MKLSMAAFDMEITKATLLDSSGMQSKTTATQIRKESSLSSLAHFSWPVDSSAGLPTYFRTTSHVPVLSPCPLALVQLLHSRLECEYVSLNGSFLEVGV